MQRFSLAVVAATLVAALAAAPGLGARVTVRVEGKTQTIFGAAPPAVDASTALEALELASVAGEFYYHVAQFSFGPYVDQVGRYAATPADGWLFKVNGALAPVGADKVTLRDGDRVLWYWAPFGERGTPTLRLERRPRGCYQVLAEDDAGGARPAEGAVLRVDGRRVPTEAGRACLTRHRGLVRATLAGAVRSNALA